MPLLSSTLALLIFPNMLCSHLSSLLASPPLSIFTPALWVRLSYPDVTKLPLPPTASHSLSPDKRRSWYEAHYSRQVLQKMNKHKLWECAVYWRQLFQTSANEADYSILILKKKPHIHHMANNNQYNITPICDYLWQPIPEPLLCCCNSLQRDLEIWLLGLFSPFRSRVLVRLEANVGPSYLRVFHEVEVMALWRPVRFLRVLESFWATVKFCDAELVLDKPCEAHEHKWVLCMYQQSRVRYPGCCKFILFIVLFQTKSHYSNIVKKWNIQFRCFLQTVFINRSERKSVQFHLT